MKPVYKIPVITALLLNLLLVGCYQQDRNCTDFKEGKFSFEYEVDGVKKTTIFERRNGIEIDYYEGRADTATVRWVSDCEYVLQKKHPRTNEEKKGISMKILTTSSDSYTFEFGMVGQAKKQHGTVRKIAD